MLSTSQAGVLLMVSGIPPHMMAALRFGMVRSGLVEDMVERLPVESSEI